MLLSATSTDMLSYCERVNVFGERCRRVVFSETGLPALPILGKPVLPYTRRLVGSCQSTPRGRTRNTRIYARISPGIDRYAGCMQESFRERYLPEIHLTAKNGHF